MKKKGIYYVVWFALYLVLCYIMSLFGVEFDLFVSLGMWVLCAVIEFIVDLGNFD